MNRAVRKLTLLAIMMLVAAAAVGCSTGSGKTPESSKSDEQASGEPSKGGDPAKVGEAAPEKIGNNTAQERRQLLETVGALTTAHCYQTYLNLGLLADGKAKGTYSDKDAYKVLDSVLALLNSLDRKLAALAKFDLDKQDRQSLELMRDLAALLRQQGKELEIFWDSGKDEDAAKYESCRKDSWAAIGKLTGIGR